MPFLDHVGDLVLHHISSMLLDPSEVWKVYAMRIKSAARLIPSSHLSNNHSASMATNVPPPLPVEPLIRPRGPCYGFFPLVSASSLYFTSFWLKMENVIEYSRMNNIKSSFKECSSLQKCDRSRQAQRKSPIKLLCYPPYTC